MKTILFSILFFGLFIMVISLITRNIYLLGFSELLIIPTMVKLIVINLKKTT